MASPFANKIIALFIVETTIPPISRANLRIYHLAMRLMKEKEFHTHIITPSFMPWTRKTSFLDKIIINQYWGFGYLIYSKLRVLVRFWHLIASILSIVYLSWYFQKHHKKKISVVHAWNPLAGLTAVIGGKLIGAQIFIDFTDFYSDIAQKDLPLFSKALFIIEKYVLKEATKVFVVSDQMKKYLTEKMTIDGKKIYIVPDGVDIDTFDLGVSGTDIKKQLGLTDENFTFIFHGDIKYDDGVDILLDALEIASKKNPNIRLMILGGGGTYFKNLKKRFDSSPLNKFVVYPGWVSYNIVPKYIAAANAGIMPMRATLNHNLYLSFKLFEYWGMAKPAIVTKLDAISDIFRNNETGLVVKNGDPEDLANAMLKLAGNPEETKRMGREGRKMVEKDFNWDVIMEKEIAVYRETFCSS